MSQESKPVATTVKVAGNEAAAAATAGMSRSSAVEQEATDSKVENAGLEQRNGGGGDTAEGIKKKKKKKKNKVQQLQGAGEDGAGTTDSTVTKTATDTKKALNSLTPQQVAQFMQLNPALANELLAESEGSSGNSNSVADLIKTLSLEDIMTGLATSGKNKKDMGAYKFWQTQPVLQFGQEQEKITEEGPLKVQEIKDVSTHEVSLAVEGFRWVTMDLTNDEEMEEVYKLLNGHYVEDDEATFRFRYSRPFLRWALMAPGWKKDWHVGIRTANTLCAFISAIPVELRVRKNMVHGSEVNFLCVHKKLRGKRLAPVLIKEITRRCNLDGVFQAIYTGGVVLPRPVSTCRYYHRALDWQKLYDIKFSPLPPGSTPKRQRERYALPNTTATPGLREMQAGDVDAVHSLLTRYLERFDLAQKFSREEIEHWMLHKPTERSERIIWSYVVETDGKITDFFSFYNLESTVIKQYKYPDLKAAYQFYYASEAGLSEPLDRVTLESRLNGLTNDALILAKNHRFDVFNALSIMDNSIFLEKQRFGPGDGQLHYYLFNYKASSIFGGVDQRNQLIKSQSSGIGFVML